MSWNHFSVRTSDILKYNFVSVSRGVFMVSTFISDFNYNGKLTFSVDFFSF